MEWKDMSPADQRRWALEQVSYAQRLSMGGASIRLFEEAEKLVNYINGQIEDGQSHRSASSALPRSEDTPDQLPHEAISIQEQAA